MVPEVNETKDASKNPTSFIEALRAKGIISRSKPIQEPLTTKEKIQKLREKLIS